MLNMSAHFSHTDTDAVEGPDTVRPMPPPAELVFTVDEKIRRDISHAKQQYLESVS